VKSRVSGAGQTREGGVVVEEFDGVFRGIETEDEVKRARGEGGGVAGGRERFAGLGELDLEAEEIGAQELAGLGAGAGDRDGGFVGADAALDGDDGLAGFAEIEGGAHDLGDEAVVRGAEIEIGGFGAGAWRRCDRRWRGRRRRGCRRRCRWR
jgi:hypothetical protein